MNTTSKPNVVRSLIIAGCLLEFIAVARPAIGDDWQNCNSGRFEDAIKIVRSCSAVLQGQEAGTEEIALRNRGQAYVKQGLLELAIYDFTKAINLDPGDARGYEMRGYAYLKKGELDLAIADFDRDIQLQPREDLRSGAYAGRGMAYEGKHAFKEAMADYAKAAEAYPPLADQWHRRIEWLAGHSGSPTQERELRSVSVITVAASGSVLVGRTAVQPAAVGEFLDSMKFPYNATVFLRSSTSADPHVIKEVTSSLRQHRFTSWSVVIDEKDPTSMQFWKRAMGCQLWRSQNDCIAAGCNWSSSEMTCEEE